MRQEPFSCVIFDIDGTLTNTNELIFASFNHITQRHLGKTFAPREIIGFFGPPEEGAIERLLGSDQVPAAMDELCMFYKSMHGKMAHLHPGIVDVLTHLRERGIKLAVFTGKGLRTASITLDEFNLTSFFDVVISGNDVENHKPDPEGIQKVISKFSLVPGEVLMVGDSVSDVLASRGAGVKVAAVLWDSYDKDRVLEAKADFVFYHVHEMLEWFRVHTN